MMSRTVVNLFINLKIEELNRVKCIKIVRINDFYNS